MDGKMVGARVPVLVHVVLGEERVFDTQGMPYSRQRMKTFGLGEKVARRCKWGMNNHLESRGSVVEGRIGLVSST